MRHSQRFRVFTVSLICCVLVGIIAGLWFFNDTPSSASAAAGEFKIQGTRIIDPAGKTFVPRGVNINGPNWVWPGEVTRDANAIANVWKFNIVRVNSFLKGDNFDDNNDTDKIVNAFTSRKVVVMFEAHDWTGTAPTGADLTLMKNWYANLAQKYKYNPYVWFDTFNEPYYCETPVPSSWHSIQQTVIQAIRNTGAKNIISVEGHTFGSDQGCNGRDELVPTNMSAILTYGPTLTSLHNNLLFQVHLYCWGTERKMNDYFNRVKNAGLAVVVGEFGSAGGGDCDSVPTTQAMYKVIKPRGIGRLVWAWYCAGGSPGWHNCLINGPNGATGAAVNSTTNPTNLTWLGRQVWNDTHS